jgi:hypothetical protein
MAYQAGNEIIRTGMREGQDSLRRCHLSKVVKNTIIAVVPCSSKPLPLGWSQPEASIPVGEQDYKAIPSCKDRP